jgi:hypothetical protein
MPVQNVSKQTLSARFETWWNQKGFVPNHPLHSRLRKFSNLGANVDFDVVFLLCTFLAANNWVQCQMIELKKQLVNKKNRFRKEFRALCTTHAKGNLRLTKVARHYTDSIIRSMMGALKAKGLLDQTAELSAGDLAEIKQQALEPLANVLGYPEDWERAMNNLPPSTAQNLLLAVGLSKDHPAHNKLVKDLMSVYWPSILRNGVTKREDLAGSMFLLLLTEYLRKVTGKPHFEAAFNLMTSFQDKQLDFDDKRKRRGVKPWKSGEVRVAKLKKQCPIWPATLARVEQMAEAQKVN